MEEGILKYIADNGYNATYEKLIKSGVVRQPDKFEAISQIENPKKRELELVCEEAVVN